MRGNREIEALNEKHDKVVEAHFKALEDKTLKLEKFRDLMRSVEVDEEPEAHATRLVKELAEV